ncbi:outer membrane protein W [Microbulbifer sp. NBRC 101763]|uniref:OmpW/AlkL family protein n=1 Tax=Microbulbifer TaxID=48073 RepID=UPI00037738E2|nr:MULTISPECIES: OmpW family outer membrane protein [Microbulbifer]WHI51914.1 OmpW family outer membrane protein [Microbulbifer sp. MLAF003]
MKLKGLSCTAITFLLTFGANFSHAQEDWRDIEWGDFIVRFGLSYVTPNDAATSLKYRVLQQWDLYNTTWEMDTAQTWQISGVWRPTDRWGFELMHINNASYDVTLDNFTGNPGRDQIQLGDFKASSTLAFANWYFLDPSYFTRPYVGAGINYTNYHTVSISRQFNEYLIDSGMAVAPGSFNMGHSWDWALQAGVDFNLDFRQFQYPLIINLAALYYMSDTDPTVDFPTELGSDRLYAHFDYDPWVINIGVGTKF